LRGFPPPLTRALAALAANDLPKATAGVTAMREASGRVLQCLDAFGPDYAATFEPARQERADGEVRRAG
jgi:hypothetical protein